MDYLVAIILGLVFLVAGVYAIYSHTKKTKRLRIEGIVVTGIIVKVRHRSPGCKAVIKYTVAGEEVSTELDHYSSFMKVGDTRELYVDKNNPKVFVTISKTPIIMGALFILMGAGLLTIWWWGKLI